MWRKARVRAFSRRVSVHEPPKCEIQSRSRHLASRRRQILSTDLSLAIFDELVPAESLEKLTFGEAIKYRKESTAREELSWNICWYCKRSSPGSPKRRLCRINQQDHHNGGPPAAREFRDKLDTIYEKLFGKIKGAALAAAGSAITWLAHPQLFKS